MHETNIKKLDYNLLNLLRALIEEKSVTRAAERVNLSQPAASRALERLRKIFQDPLLVKNARTMVLTTRAEALYFPLQNLLNDLKTFITPITIDPAEMHGEIVIATRDYETAVILPSVIKRLSIESPGIRLQIVTLRGDDLSPLEHHHVDFILAATDNGAANLHRAILYHEKYSCLTCKDNNKIRGSISLKSYLAARHCMVTISGFGTSIVDNILAEQGHKRHIVVRLPNFLAVGHIVTGSDLIVTVPKKLACLLSTQGNFNIYDPPIPLPQFPIYLYWHTRHHNSPRHQWIKKMIQSAV